ncbi:putative signal peptide protein [Puccinia sorghi]|uniref:Putative signal peptide protein n=1 Tax=Puccinia sorghi TaxID=27349 RepID=A0A0L6VFG3_9BASI|nr:putative signal peptide protein [Puccinia sorghi]
MLCHLVAYLDLVNMTSSANTHQDLIPEDYKHIFGNSDVQKFHQSFRCYSRFSPRVIPPRFDAQSLCILHSDCAKKSTNSNRWGLDSLAGACCMSTADKTNTFCILTTCAAAESRLFVKAIFTRGLGQHTLQGARFSALRWGVVSKGACLSSKWCVIGRNWGVHPLPQHASVSGHRKAVIVVILPDTRNVVSSSRPKGIPLGTLESSQAALQYFSFAKTDLWVLLWECYMACILITPILILDNLKEPICLRGFDTQQPLFVLRPTGRLPAGPCGSRDKSRNIDSDSESEPKTTLGKQQHNICGTTRGSEQDFQRTKSSETRPELVNME